MSPSAPHLRLVTPDFSPPAAAPAALAVFAPRARPRRAAAGRRPLGQILIDMKAV
ncbi:hypothetical protein [Albidovulum sp.]|uniref:hypothetical protein n=1 Tax=Albidovulum sp. TaxID=1872424 RepID=UPI0039B8E6F0